MKSPFATHIESTVAGLARSVEQTLVRQRAAEARHTIAQIAKFPEKYPNVAAVVAQLGDRASKLEQIAERWPVKQEGYSDLSVLR